MNGARKPKMEAVVVGAIRRLRDVQGSTPREIGNYISMAYGVPASEIKRRVQLALRRGVSYGILQRSRGGTYVCDKNFLGRVMDDDNDELTERGHRRGRCRKRRRRRRMKKCKKRRRRRSRRRRKCKRRRRRRSRKKKCKRKRRRRRSKRKCKRRHRTSMAEYDSLSSRRRRQRGYTDARNDESLSNSSSVSEASDGRNVEHSHDNPPPIASPENCSLD